MKRTNMLFGLTLLFSLFLLKVNTCGVQYISFSSNRTGQSDIYIIDTNGENLHNLTNHVGSGCCATWAPDGRSFAFALFRDETSEIYIKTYNEAQTRRLTNHPEIDYAPAWSPDGNWIAFHSNRTGGFHVYKIDINGENLQRLTNQGIDNLDPSWSLDGQSIAFSSIGNDGSGISMMDADGKNRRLIINPQHAGGPPRYPAWSPDGKQIACTFAEDGRGIYIMETDGQNARRISPLGTWSYNPAWSPDGKWIAYDAFEVGIANPWQNPNAERHIFIVSVEGGEPRQITQHPGRNSSPAWVTGSFYSVSPTVDTQTTLWGRLKQAERMTQ